MNSKTIIVILSLAQVCERTSMSRSAIYRAQADPVNPFPRSIALSTRRIGWVEAEVNGWLERRVELARAKQADAA